MSELLPKQKGLLQIWKELKKGFKNNPDNLATFDTMANMIPPLAVYRGGQTLSNVPEKFQKGQYKDAAIDTALGGLDVVGGLMPMMGTMRTVSAALPKGVPLKQAGAVLGSGKIAEKLDPIHGSKVDAWVYENDKALNLSKLVANERGQGFGTAFMNDLVAEADKTGKRIDLSPSADFGGNKKRLEEFYKRFGFVPNKGRTKDLEISESMYRQPAMNMPKRPVNGAVDHIKSLTGYKITDELPYDVDLGTNALIKGNKADVQLSVREDSSGVYLNNIQSKVKGDLTTQAKGTGEGTAVVKALKNYSDKTGKPLYIVGATASGAKYWDNMGWLKPESVTVPLDGAKYTAQRSYAYHPVKPRPVNALGQEIPPTQYELAQEAARIDAWKNHGLPENNTAMDRARAMGFDTNVLHGAKNADQSALIASKGGELGPGSYVTRDGNLASEFAHDAYGAPFPEGSGVYPLTTKSLAEMPRKEWVSKRASKFDDLQRENGGEWSGEFYNQGHERMRQDAENAGFSGYYTPGEGGVNQGVVFDPKNIRSRFAAFNMSNRDSSDLLASYLLPTATTGALGYSLLTPNESWAR